MDNETLATEMLRELKANSKRWFIAFLVALGLWFATIGVFFWYISLPIEEVEIEQYTDGDANTLVGIGDNNADNTESNETQESETHS